MNKKNIIALSLLVLLVILFVVSKGRENREVRRDLYNLAQGDIHKIEIVQHADTLVVSRDGHDWWIEYPRRLPVKESHIQRFFTELLGINHSTISISDSPTQQSFYHVCDETANKVTLYGTGDKKLKKVYFGRGQNPQIAHVRAENDNSIYQIESIFTVINPSVNVWRDDVIVNVMPESISSIAVSHGTQAYQIISDGGSWVYSGDTTQMIAPHNPELQKLLGTLSSLNTNVFFDDVYAEYASKLATPALEMLITLHSGENIYLKVAKNDEQSYVVQRNESQDILYRLTTQRYNQLLVNVQRLLEEE